MSSRSEQVQAVRNELETAKEELENAISEADDLCSRVSAAERSANDAQTSLEDALSALDELDTDDDDEKDEEIAKLKERIGELEREKGSVYDTTDAFVCHDRVFRTGATCPQCDGPGVLLFGTLVQHAELLNRIAKLRSAMDVLNALTKEEVAA